MREGAFVIEDRVSSLSCVIASFSLTVGPNMVTVNAYTKSRGQARTFLEMKGEGREQKGEGEAEHHVNIQVKRVMSADAAMPASC